MQLRDCHALNGRVEPRLNQIFERDVQDVQTLQGVCHLTFNRGDAG
jgi:hypothetical protein